MTCKMALIDETDMVCCSTRISSHLVLRLERKTRERPLPGKSSSFVRQRVIRCGYFIVILHLGTVHKTESRSAFSVLCAYSFGEPSASCAPTAHPKSR